MIPKVFSDKPTKLFIALTSFFVANAVVAECIGGKIFSLEKFLGIPVSHFTVFGQSGLSYALTCGVLLWPFEFVLTDVVNEFFGAKAIKRISFIAVILISYAFFMFFFSMKTPPADFWLSSRVDAGVPDMQYAFSAIFGQGMWIIAGSICAFLISQLVDVYVFHKIKKYTGEKKVWLRATGSTLVSQLIDSFVVLFIAFKLGNDWSWQLVLAICLVNYSYKAFMALILTPLIYLLEFGIEKYLGKELALQLKAEAQIKRLR